MPIASKMRTLGDAGLYKYKWCNNLREVEQVDIFFLKDIADTIRYFVGNNIGFLYHNESKLFVCVSDSSIANVQHAVSQLFNSNIVVEYQNNTNLVEVLAAEFNILLGEEKFTLTLDNDTQTLCMDFTLSVWDTKMNDIKRLLNRVLPMNLDVDILVDGVPAIYTQLEYLETSGTQWSSLGKCPTYIGARAMLTYNDLGNRFLLSTASGEFIFLRCVQTTDTTVGMWGTVNHEGPHVWPLKEVVLRKVEIFQNWKMDGNALLKDPYSDWTYTHNNGFPSQLEQVDKNLWLFTYNGYSYNFIGKIYYITISQHEDIYMDLVPVLDVNGTPCIYDKISRTCFYNSGSGTFGYRIKTPESEVSMFSLRDPYYTAPSGIWAKLIAENELDIIADTEMQDGEEQGYIWFANTGEAYEHFGIKE